MRNEVLHALAARHASRPRRACSRFGLDGASGGTRGVRRRRARAVRCRPRGRCLRGMGRRVPRVDVDAVARSEKVHAEGGGDAHSGACARPRFPGGGAGGPSRDTSAACFPSLAPRRLRDSPPARAIAVDAATKHNLKHTRRSPGGARRQAPPRRFVLRHIPHLRSTRTHTRILHSTPLVFQDVPGLGRDGEVLAVKPGRARNHLVPGRMAAYATPDRLPEAAERARGVGRGVRAHRADGRGRRRGGTYGRVRIFFFAHDGRRSRTDDAHVRRRRFPGFSRIPARERSRWPLSRFSLDDRETNARGDE